MISPKQHHDHSYSAIHSSKQPRTAHSTRKSFSSSKKQSLPSKRLRLKSPKRRVVLVEDENNLRNGAPASPPPPPPPLLEFDTCMQTSRKKISRLDMNDSAEEDSACGKDLSQALLHTGYIERVSKQAREYRKLKETKKVSGVPEARSFKATIERLRKELQKKEAAEVRLLDLNRRLQERLKLFHKQNQENVAAAKAQIASLKKQRRRHERDEEVTVSDQANQEKVPLLRLKSVMRIHFAAWDRIRKIRRFAKTSRRRRLYELKARTLREWACNAITLKICARAVERKARKTAKKCLRSWEEYIWIVHAKKRAVARADDYRVYILNYRRCFQDWKRFTARSKSNSQHVEQLLQTSLKLCHRDTLRHYFSAWNAARIRGKQQTTVLLMRVFSKWKTELLHTHKLKIKESELAILSLAQLSRSQFASSSNSLPQGFEQHKHKSPVVVSNMRQVDDSTADTIHSASLPFQ